MKFKLLKKVVFKGIGGITFYPGTLLVEVCKPYKQKCDVVFCSPISKRAKSQVHDGFKDWLKAGFPFKKTEVKTIR